MLQDLQKQKECKEEELLELQKVANERKSKVDALFIITLCSADGSNNETCTDSQNDVYYYY